MSDTKVPRLLRIREVCERTSLQKWRLYELIARGEGPPHMKVGRTIRISEAALTKWIDEQHSTTHDEDTNADGAA
jgi:excisionase family DNA binding protein